MARTSSIIVDEQNQDYRLLTDAAKASRAAYLRHLMRRDLRGRVTIGASLDIGCADGLFLDLLNQEGWQASGVEPFAGLAGDDPRISRAPIEHWDHETSFELITMIHSLEHIADPCFVLQKVQSLLKPGGLLLIAVPNYGGAWSRLTDLHWPWLNLREHHYHYTPAALRQLLEAADLVVESVRTSSREAPSIVIAALDRLGMFERTSFGRRLISSVLFRTSGLLRRPANYLLDRFQAGAEIIVIARRRPDR